MTTLVVVSVRLHDGFYFGSGKEPHSPARLFQALIAGSGISGPRDAASRQALMWLEHLHPPTIAVPYSLTGKRYVNYVPDNDLDHVGGDHRRVGKIRAAKTIKPKLFNQKTPFHYAWTFEPDTDATVHAEVICRMADRIFQFGRGVDMAWGWGDVMNEGDFNDQIAVYPGVVYRPSRVGDGVMMACPGPGTLDSLCRRHASFGRRFKTVRSGASIKKIYSQPSKPYFVPSLYNSSGIIRVFELRERSAEISFSSWPLASASNLVTQVRDKVFRKLSGAMPAETEKIDRFLIGRRADGEKASPPDSRIRLIPLPSIGHHHADLRIRRIAVEVPPGCPIRSDDVFWAVSGIEVNQLMQSNNVDVVPAADESILRHFGIGNQRGSCKWRSITAVALPRDTGRRRIDPGRRTLEAKSGMERAAEQFRAGSAVIQALRHAGIRKDVASIRVQKEPFYSHGLRVEEFAAGTRFEKERLWHVEIVFNGLVDGPIMIGDGRFMGFGLMAPFEE